MILNHLSIIPMSSVPPLQYTIFQGGAEGPEEFSSSVSSPPSPPPPCSFSFSFPSSSFFPSLSFPFPLSSSFSLLLAPMIANQRDSPVWVRRLNPQQPFFVFVILWWGWWFEHLRRERCPHPFSSFLFSLDSFRDRWETTIVRNSPPWRLITPPRAKKAKLSLLFPFFSVAFFCVFILILAAKSYKSQKKKKRKKNAFGRQKIKTCGAALFSLLFFEKHQKHDKKKRSFLLLFIPSKPQQKPKIFLQVIFWGVVDGETTFLENVIIQRFSTSNKLKTSKDI